jgi:predicted nucleic acid-binding protein
VREAIADTGPVLHLHEIGRLDCLAVFDSLLMPDLVVEELHTYGLDPSGLTVAGLHVVVVPVAREEWAPVMTELACWYEPTPLADFDAMNWKTQ